MSILVITGARGRLAGVVAEKFQQLGYSIVGIDSSVEEDEHGPNYHANLTDEQSVREVFERIWSDTGGFDILIHTVGMWDAAPTVDLSLDRWREIMDVNLTSTFLVFREVLRRLAEVPGSDPVRLIAFTSAQGADRAVAEQAAYSAAKSGVIRLVESISAEYPDGRVTAHAIAPSTIIFDDMHEENGISVHDLASLCVVLAGETGDSMSGVTVRAYGTAV
jgi:3-oxoacyl-[acyl-carrier protein] reductase